jgi:hypothetical protein
MDWKKILKEQQTLDLEFEEKEKPKQLPIADVAQSRIDSVRWKKPLTSEPPKTATPKTYEREDDGPTGDDVKESLAEIRAKFLKKPRGLYSDLADKVSRLSAKSREEAQSQKKILGYIRKIIREANIPEADL